MISIKDLTKKIRGDILFSGISFDVDQGQMLVIVGKEHSGKTLLMRIITGFEHADSGEIIIDGTNCINNLEYVKMFVGYVPESLVMYGKLTVKEYIKMFIEMNDMPVKETLAIADNLLEYIGLEDYKRKYIRKLTKGQQMKLSIARALIQNPKVLIIDNPFTELTEQDIYEVKDILEFFLESGGTIVMTLDDLQIAAWLNTKVMILDKGRLIDGEPYCKVYRNNMQTDNDMTEADEDGYDCTEAEYSTDEQYSQDEMYSQEEQYSQEDIYGSEEQYSQEETYGTEEQYSQEDIFNPNEQYSQEDIFNPDEQYSQEESYGSDEQYDKNSEYDMNMSYDYNDEYPNNIMYNQNTGYIPNIPYEQEGYDNSDEYTKSTEYEQDKESDQDSKYINEEQPVQSDEYINDVNDSTRDSDKGNDVEVVSGDIEETNESVNQKPENVNRGPMIRITPPQPKHEEPVFFNEIPEHTEKRIGEDYFAVKDKMMGEEFLSKQFEALRLMSGRRLGMSDNNKRDKN